MKIKIVLLLFLCILKMSAQNTPVDSLQHTKFKYKPLVLPALLVSYGLVTLNSPSLISIDTSIQESFDTSKSTHVDDVTMLLPALSVYGLNMVGVKGKHDFKNRTLIIGTASVIVLSTVIATKLITQKERPNEASNDSFPSGHTAIAFMGAEFLYQEYKHISPWYGIVGYGVAATTGYLRMYNNKHWFSDVVAGAGFGILSTKLAYLMHPYLQKKLFKSNTSTSFVTPFYNGEYMGVSFVKSF
jgi:membrane-associated phospholipid phosphatase